MEDNKSGLYIVAIVGVVALVAMVIMITGSGREKVVVSSGSALTESDAAGLAMASWCQKPKIVCTRAGSAYCATRSDCEKYGAKELPY
jgi:hypothetical protein